VKPLFEADLKTEQATLQNGFSHQNVFSLQGLGVRIRLRDQT